MRVGLIGTGLQGKRRSSVLKPCGDELVAVASANIEMAQKFTDEMGGQPVASWEEVTKRNDIDVVIISTPPNLHEAVSVSALENGKHVLCEKPLARTPEEAQNIVEAAKRNNLKVKCGFNLRHHPGLQQAREWFDKGLIGEAMFIRCLYGIGGRLGYEEDWRAKAEISGGGQLMDQGMHAIDLCSWFMGKFNQATGFTQTGYWDIAPLEDNAFCLLRTEIGQVASIHVSWTQWKNIFSFELFGKDGYITVKGLGGSYGMETATLGKRAFMKPFHEEIVEFRGADHSWEKEWQEFKSAISENRQPLANGQDGLEAVKLAHMVYEAADKLSIQTVKG